MADLRLLSDDALLALTREDVEAFGVLYERHVRAVLAFLRRQGLDTETSLDLTAEVFAAALVASRRYRPGEAPARAWKRQQRVEPLLVVAAPRQRAHERQSRDDASVRPLAGGGHDGCGRLRAVRVVAGTKNGGGGGCASEHGACQPQHRCEPGHQYGITAATPQRSVRPQAGDSSFARAPSLPPVTPGDGMSISFTGTTTMS